MAMKLGAEPRKIALLAILGVVLVYVLFFNSSQDAVPQRTASAVSPSVAPPPPSAVQPRQQSAQKASAPRRSGERLLQEFRPSFKPKRPEDRPDPMSIDPALRTDILAKLQSVNVTGSHRSIFEFTAAPAAAPDPKTLAAAKTPVPSPLIGPQLPPKEAPKTPPAAPPPPPIPLKFFGYVSSTGRQAGPKRAFFLEGEDIHVVNEGDMVKRRYKIVRIGVNTVTVEDTQYKNTQNLPLEEQPG